LEESVAWSYRLHDSEEQVLFRRLAVFAGGFTADAAEHAAGAPPLRPVRVLSLLAALTSKSLVQLESARSTSRYRMLETIREFAGELLTESGEAAAVGDRHLSWGRPSRRRGRPVRPLRTATRSTRSKASCPTCALRWTRPLRDR
jgi:predicted ATPase